MSTPAPGPAPARDRLDPADRLVQILNDACLALMLSVGHRTGLWAAMADGLPRSSTALAERAGLQERYVREWLGAMTVGRLVAHGPAELRYRLTPEYADLLTDDGAANLAVFAQYVAVLGGVEDAVVNCFRHGGGVPYDAYPRFQEVMAADSAQTVLATLDEAIVPLVPGLAERLEAGIDVLDVGCGRGRALQHLARRHPASRFVGVDLSETAIATAREEGTDLPNLRFVAADATRLGDVVPACSQDLVTTFDAVHDQPHPAQVLAGIRAVLRPGGHYLAQDINTSGSPAGDLDHPLGPFLYTISCLHCMTVSLADGGDGLGAAWGRPRARRMLHEAGFGHVEEHLLPHDEQNVYYVCA